jgi:hypothetical protein
MTFAYKVATFFKYRVKQNVFKSSVAKLSVMCHSRKKISLVAFWLVI